MIQKSSSEVTPFGGTNLVHQEIIDNNIPGLILEVLGKRSDNAVYSYPDLILNRFYTALCGGDCAEDTTYMHSVTKHLKGLKVPSPDTILNMENDLSVPTTTTYTDRGVKNEVNINGPLNKLLVKAAVKTGVLKTGGEGHCMDFDHQFIPADKYDAQYSYKKERGYFPGVASIGNTPVYVEGRNGNCSVKHEQLPTLKRSIGLLEDSKVKVNRCRMDSGSYISGVCDWLEESNIKFHIRAMRSNGLLVDASVAEGWTEVEVGHQKYEACSIKYTFGKHVHRMVCYRRPNSSGQISGLTADAKSYQFIITNDWEQDEETVIKFYNARGDSERLFDIQNNDFNWSAMPYSFLNQNTSYLLVMAICHVLYQWIISIFSKLCDFIEPGQRLKKFRFRFISMAAKVTRSGRRQVITLFTQNNIKIKGLSP
jgi:hypothetical protein